MTLDDRRFDRPSTHSRFRALLSAFFVAAAVVLAGHEVGASGAPITVGEVSPPADTEPTETSSGDDETVADFEDRLTEEVELIQVMSEIADVSKRTYALEQQRDLQNTRGVFFGFVVSVAVLVAGWAPVVAADDWAERVWIQLDAEDQEQTA